MENRLKYYTLICATVAASMFYSCSDEEGMTQWTGCDGVAKLTKITSSTDFNTALTASNLGDWIVLHGENLCAAKSIVVNGVKVNMREVFLESSKATLRVPRELPADGATNAVEVISDGPSAKLDVTIDIPDLIVESLDNEYANVGDTVNVNGWNFDLYDITDSKGKVYFGSTEANIVATAEKYVSVIIPAGVQVNDLIRVVGEKVEKKATGRYKDNRGWFFPFTDCGWGWGTDMLTDGSKPGDIKPCDGQYVHVIRNCAADDYYPFLATGCTWSKDHFDNPDKYYLKFEIATLSALTKRYLNFDQTNYAWKPWTVTEFNTYGKWKTITLEFKDVLNGGNQSNTPVFQVAFKGEVAENINICIDNFRIVPKE